MIRSKDNFLQVSDGAWIYFEDYGKDKGEPIMILHGFLCSSKFFYKNIDALSADHRLVLIDVAGARFFVKNASKSHYGPLCQGCS